MEMRFPSDPTFPKGARGFSVALFEATREMEGILEACAVGDFRYAQAGFPQPGRSLLHADAPEIIHRGFGEVCPKETDEMIRAESGTFGEVGEGDGFGVMFLDETLNAKEGRSLIGAWIALDDATIENGCLWIIPGSQARDSLEPGVAWGQTI